MKKLKNSPTLNSYNSSKITQNSSSIITKPSRNNHYSNSSIFESQIIPNSREVSARPIKSKKEVYLTDLDDNNELEIIQTNPNEHNMNELFDYKPTVSGRILPNIRRRPPTMIYCCNEKFEAKNLSHLYDKYWVNPPKKRVILNHRRERIKVRDTSSEYIEKTKSIILERYNLKIKKDCKLRIENNIRNEIKSLDNTMDKIKKYQFDLEHNFIQKMNDELIRLFEKIKEEKLILEQLSVKVISLMKEDSYLKTEIKKANNNKLFYEKWIIFLIQMDKKTLKKIPPESLKLILKQEYNNELIFKEVEEVMEWFTNSAQRNFNYLLEYNKVKKDKEEVEKKYLEDNKITRYELILENEIKEKEKLLNLLKIRNETLEKEKQYVKKLKLNQPKRKVKRSFSTFVKPKKLNDGIYLRARFIYSDIKLRMSKELKNINIDEELDKCNTNEEKTLKMLTIAEITLTYLLFKYDDYKNNPRYKNILKEVLHEIELKHKIETANQRKIEDQKRLDQLAEKLRQKSMKFIYVPKRKIDMYPSAIYAKPKRTITESNDKNELTLYDFLYDAK
jgi:hypothetical protein